LATDATGTPTSLGIPTLNTGADKPTGVGINAMMAAIDALIVARTVSLPSGMVAPFAGGTVPTGWLACDGTAYSTTAKANLFTAISGTWGNGGAGTFRVPDFRGRGIIGDGTGAGLTGRSVGQTGGEETHVLSTGEMPVHSHTLTDPGHSHSVTHNSGAGRFVVEGTGSAGANVTTGGGIYALDPATAGTVVTNISMANAGSGTAHNNMHPFGVCKWIIKE
jgi:microcystin-dependent protein